jgi:hypothetical protein
MPNCYTPLEELTYTFGGPWPFALILSCILVLLALLLNTLRIKLVRSSSSYGENSIQHHSHHQFPYFLSLSEVQYCQQTFLFQLTITASILGSTCHITCPIIFIIFILNQVRGTRAEETQSHVYRMYFMGPNTFREPWHLPYSPPTAIIEIV